MNAIVPVSETAETVTLMRADYETLLDATGNAADLAAVRRHRAEEERAGFDVAKRGYLTGDEMNRLLDGESPVKIWRQKRGMTQRALAAAAHVSPAYVAEIEAGRKPGSATALRSLAEALGTPMESLVKR